MEPAVSRILEEHKKRFGKFPDVVQFDEGGEFYNQRVLPLLKKHGINYFSTRLTSNRWEFCRSMRGKTNACVPRDVSREKRGKFCKHLKGFKTKINRMNEENFAAFFVLLAFIQLSFTVTSLTGETNGNRRETKALA